MKLDNYEFYDVNTLVIGSGAAGLNSVIHFIEAGGNANQILLVTDQLGGGTSFNAGSDKQTYYKLSLGGDMPDDVYQMANTYCKGGSMHGDIALIESANSVREFMHLVSLGVPFPTNKYGEYIGYKTDNDPLQRASSVGPLTSKVMAQALLKRVKELEVKILDHIYCFKILDIDSRKLVIGLKIENLSQVIQPDQLDTLTQNIVVFLVDNIIAATGGSSCIYENSVYPESQWGSLGLLIDYGCETQNLTESQFGLASTDFRWNVSGTYQQAIPTYLSAGSNESIDSASEFLNNHFPSKSKLLDAIFLKGYQWPFNVERIKNYGSSLIDLLVFKETTEKRRKVFLDYTRNPQNLSITEIFKLIDIKHANYLKNSGIDGSEEYNSPIKRLKKINPKAYQLYLSHDIDLEKEPLVISLCIQHCNGGISGNIWWESSKSGVFVIGEANGSHGVHRPGGAALNSGQVGGLRASLKIVHNNYKIRKSVIPSIDSSKILKILSDYTGKISQILIKKTTISENPVQLLRAIKSRMAKYGSIKRAAEGLHSELDLLMKKIVTYFNEISLTSTSIGDILHALRVYDAFLTHVAYLESINLYLSENGGSRGCYLVEKSGKFLENTPRLNQYVVKTIWNGSEFSSHLENVRKIPRDSNWFEIIWKEYENGSWID